MPKAIDKKITSSFTSFIYKYIGYIFILMYVKVCLLRFSVYYC